MATGRRSRKRFPPVALLTGAVPAVTHCEKYSVLYCLSFNPNVNKEEREESWNFINLTADYKRMGVPNNLWVTTAANSEYRVCDTYPSELFVPKSATPAVIVGSSKFRSRGRFPVLSYFHQDTLAAVCRCSQPLSGFSGRCQEDEMMLQTVMKSNPGSDFIYVVDTQPKLNAMANRAAGKGYENEDHYTNIKLQFIGMENIHVMRSSQQKIIDVGEMRSPSMTDFLWGLENSGWLKHIKAIMDAGVFIAREEMWEGLYNHVEKSTLPRQSPADYLSAVREESHQLEEELTNHQERIAALTGKPVMWEKINIPRRRTNQLRQNSQTLDSALLSPLGLQLQSPDLEELSACSDLESGVADLSSRSSSGGDDGKDPDLE
ncbi:phosphatidylinositol-3-phosphate phosphatase MTMR7-like [Xenentodon cancila]